MACETMTASMHRASAHVKRRRVPPRGNNDGVGVPHQCSRADFRLLSRISTGLPIPHVLRCRCPDDALLLGRKQRQASFEPNLREEARACLVERGLVCAVLVAQPSHHPCYIRRVQHLLQPVNRRRCCVALLAVAGTIPRLSGSYVFRKLVGHSGRGKRNHSVA